MKKTILISFMLICLLITATLLSNPKSKAAPKVRLNVNSVELTKNQSYVLRVYNAKKKYKLYYDTLQKNVIQLPKVSAKKRKIKFNTIDTGTDIIQVTVKQKKRVIAVLSCYVTVTPQAISVKFTKKHIEMVVGSTYLLKPIIKPNNSSSFPIYSSSDERVAIVNAKGRIQALSGGETTITATLPSGQSTSCNLTVLDSGNATTRPPKKQKRALLFDIVKCSFYFYGKIT